MQHFLDRERQPNREFLSNPESPRDGEGAE